MLACLNIFAVVALAAPRGFETQNIVLYQTDDVLEERLPDIAKLNDYIKRLRDVCQKFFAGTTAPETLDVVVAVRPGRQSRIWFVSSVQSTPDASRKSLRKSLENVTPCDVTSGSIAFAIGAKIAGAMAPNEQTSQCPWSGRRPRHTRATLLFQMAFSTQSGHGDKRRPASGCTLYL